jgi:hypothetical protein
MARLIELVFVAFILYYAFRRIATPISRGYDERERERRAEQMTRTNRGTAAPLPKLDRTHAKDADFKDLA